MKNTLSLLLLTFVLFSCSSSSKTKQNSSENTNVEKHLVLDFYSKASGINHDAYKEAVKILDRYSEKSDCGTSYKRVNYGREGERQLCITATNEKCFNNLLEELNYKLGEEERVRIEENKTCRK